VDKASRFGRGVLQGVADYLETYGPWSLCLDHHASGSYANNWLRHWNGDGILGFVSTRVLAGQLRRSRVSVVEVSGTRLDLQLPQVINDEPLIGRIAADHLQQRRFRQFAFFGYSNTAWSERRLTGFQDSNAKAGCSTETYLCAPDRMTLTGWEKTEQEVTRWL